MAGTNHCDLITLSELCVISIFEGEMEAVFVLLKLDIAPAKAIGVVVAAHCPEHHYGHRGDQ